MQEEPIDRHRDHWMERKRRIDHEEAKRRDEMESRYHEGPGPPMVGRPDVRLGPLNPGDSSRNGYSPRTQLPSINNLTNGAEEQHSRDDADAAYKRRRLAEGMDAADDRRRGESFTPPEHAPAHHARPDMRPPQHRYGEEREMRLEDRSPQDGHFGPRPNGRLSPLDDRGRPMRSPGVAGAPLPRSQDFRKPSVLSGGPEEVVDGSPSMPGLARRRGDAAQAKASRLHIDTGSGPTGGFDMSSMGSRSAGVAKSAPPQKLTFEREGMEPPQAYEAGRRDAPRHLHPQAAGNYPPMTAAHPPRDFRAVSGSRLHEISEAAGRRDPRDDGLVGRDGQRLPEHPQTANPLARQAPALNRGLGGVGGGYVPQTATLPSPAYHTTQFARGGPSVHRAPGPQPPHTARLPEHLRSPPSSKAHFLGLFSDFYESLHDSRTLKATLEDQIRRSNTLLHTLQSSRRVLEETVERRVREERVMWEGRVRGLEARVRELESKNGEGGAEGSASSGRGSPSASSRPKADASRSSSATREAANDKMPSPPLHKPGFARTASKASLSAHRPAADRRGDVDDDDHDMDDHGERDELSAEP
ncbi:uncharacterized protein PFL1_02822 [Pseudozyma flocculosa PF-1]|uniref:Uncharacterized protein n=1 Tax=Pseudozyma flocculosa PF-1 TaxID=1277687 RepID=A0A061HAG4_9BASI|nr:uncharacterized protein PFL1_02822 [Pseudozyma flocculosa PF-1]EPQ29603.1 hypothetical protein PFL1_02822 [Pseudozyma flocculosa PF-1]